MKAVGKHFPKVAEKAYARYGPVWAGLLADWPEIAGSPLCDYCVLEKITWPRHAASQSEQKTSSRSRHQQIGGTLTIRVAYGHALEVQHSGPQIIDKINAYFGYSSIAQIKIIQGKVEKPQVKPQRTLSPLPPAASAQLDSQMSEVDSDKLKNALHRLAKGVLAN